MVRIYQNVFMDPLDPRSDRGSRGYLNSNLNVITTKYWGKIYVKIYLNFIFDQS
jgi:hypothetical protein